MKTFTYAAAIALLTASTAFAQSSNSTMGTAGSTRGQAGISADRSATMGQSSNDMKGSMARPGKAGSSDMNNDSDMGKSSSQAPSSSKAMSHQASRDNANANHMANNKGMKGGTRSDDAQANQETAQLNQGQLSGHGMMSNGMGNNGGAMNGNGNSFDNGRPQAAQAGGPDCTPDNPSCGTARRNPAINSSPQHRLQGASPE